MSAARKWIWLLALAALGACTNDYEQFDFPGAAGSSGPSDADVDLDQSSSAGAAGSAPDEANAPVSEADARENAQADDAADRRDQTPDASPPWVSLDGSLSEAEASLDGPEQGTDAGADSNLVDAGADVVDGAMSTPDASVEVDAEGAETSASDASEGAEADAPADVVLDCGPNRKACGGSCVALDDPLTGCAAASCAPCTLRDATPTCDSTGRCAIAFCGAGFDDCDLLADTGCETSLADDPANCGACGRSCSPSGALSRQCAGGVCASTCQLGFANCARPVMGADDGCERAVSRDDTNCGGCGNDCTKQGATTGFSCSAGATPSSQCACTSDVICNLGAASGTCDVTTGQCRCGGAACRPGEACRNLAGGADACTCGNGSACGANQTCCQTPNGCRSLKTDPSNCGACGRACPLGFFCSDGECACTASSQCYAGSPGTCSAGQCSCTATTLCAKGQRCQPDGTCG